MIASPPSQTSARSTFLNPRRYERKVEEAGPVPFAFGTSEGSERGFVSRPGQGSMQLRIGFSARSSQKTHQKGFEILTGLLSLQEDTPDDFTCGVAMQTLTLQGLRSVAQPENPATPPAKSH